MREFIQYTIMITIAIALGISIGHYQADQWDQQRRINNSCEEEEAKL